MLARPTMFIGSSKEGLAVAKAIKNNLWRDIEITTWPHVFEPTKNTLEELAEIVSKFDFGVFVFSRDDVSTIRRESSPAVRDNVVFEAGIFIGRLGRERVFLTIPHDDEPLHLPTDLLGTTLLEYDTQRQDKHLPSATEPACDEISKIVKELGGFRASTGVVAYGDKVVLMAFNGSYIQVESNEQGTMKANVDNQSFGNWDKFEVVSATGAVPGRAVKFGDRIGLKSLKNGKFVWVDFNNDQNAVGATATDPKDWETFVIQSTKPGRLTEGFVTYGASFGLLSDQEKSTQRRFVAHKGDTGTFWAKSETIGNWERLMFVEPE